MIATTMKRAAWLTIGLAALALGALGVVLPLLPTTPFVLVSAYAFARSSDRLQAWLLRHRVFGPLIVDWQRYGAISRPAKIASVISMAAILVLSLVLEAPVTVIVVQAVVICACSTFILTRPSPPAR